MPRLLDGLPVLIIRTACHDDNDAPTHVDESPRLATKGVSRGWCRVEVKPDSYAPFLVPDKLEKRVSKQSFGVNNSTAARVTPCNEPGRRGRHVSRIVVSADDFSPFDALNAPWMRSRIFIQALTLGLTRLTSLLMPLRAVSSVLTVDFYRLYGYG